MNHVRENNYFYVYLLSSLSTGKWYIGCTKHLQKRLKEHEQGKSSYTKNKGPFKLIYFEASLAKDDAFKREKYLKSGMGRRYLKNRLKIFLSLT